MPALDTGFQTRPTRVAEVAILHRPGDFAIVAHTTELPVDDGIHGDVVGAGAHLKTQFTMADLAAKTHPVKPMWKNDRSHAFRLSPIIEYDIAILSLE